MMCKTSYHNAINGTAPCAVTYTTCDETHHTLDFSSRCVSHLGFQVNVRQRHLGDLVKTQGERNGTQDKKCVVDRNPHEHNGVGLCGGHPHQQGADQIHDQEHQADKQEEQVQRQPVCPEAKTEKEITDTKNMATPN